jgi:hypothetical protein
MVGELREGQNFYNTLKNLLGLSGDVIEGFRQEFYNSGRNSINAFLEHRTELMEVGKAAIAVALINYENPDRVIGFGEDNWLRYMYNQLNTSFDEFGKNQLSFITFNYDRVVEWFLLTCLQNSFEPLGVSQQWSSPTTKRRTPHAENETGQRTRICGISHITDARTDQRRAENLADK